MTLSLNLDQEVKKMQLRYNMSKIFRYLPLVIIGLSAFSFLLMTVNIFLLFFFNYSLIGEYVIYSIEPQIILCILSTIIIYYGSYWDRKTILMVNALYRSFLGQLVFKKIKATSKQLENIRKIIICKHPFLFEGEIASKKICSYSNIIGMFTILMPSINVLLVALTMYLM